MNVTLRQLRAFVAVARAGGFTAAAPQLHLTQSATSLLVRELEAQLGLSLIDRTTRQISLTAAGSEFLLSAERVLADLTQALTDTQELAQRRRGRVTIASTPLLAANFLPSAIARFEQLHPGIVVRLADVPTEKIVQLVKSGDADLGLGVFPQQDDKLHRQPMLQHRLGVMVPSHWPLARRRSNLRWADLSGLPMITLSQATGFRSLVDPFLHQAGVTVTPAYEVGQLSTAVGFAQAGLGITVVPAYVGLLLRSNKARFRALYSPVVQRHVDLISRAGRSLSPGAEAFRDCLAARCAAFQG